MSTTHYKRYKYRLYPTPEQEEQLARVFGCVRVVYNDALRRAQDAYRETGKYPGRFELQKMMAADKKTEERAWLYEVGASFLQYSIINLDRAYRNFFDSVKGKRKGPRVSAPKFKKKQSRQSASCTLDQKSPHQVVVLNAKWAYIKVPKLGQVKFRLTRELPSRPKTATIIKEPDGRYFVSFIVQVEDEPLSEAPNDVVGIDLGLTDLAILAKSNGERSKVRNPKYLREAEKRLKTAQRRLSRKKKGSNRYERQRKVVAKQHAKVRNTRLDYLHKQARAIVDENQVIAMEKLSVAGLAKTRLGKSIYDASWSTLVRLIQEKAESAGRTFVQIDQWAPTSQVCSVCGVRNGKKPLHVRMWTCPECGAVLDRDYNAAVNVILAAGFAESLNARGEDVRRALASVSGANLDETRTTPIPTLV